MPLHILSEKHWFPPASDAMEDGLLAIGGDVTANRLLMAYQKGIFPWYNDDLPLWWSPDPRFVLFPDELKVSKSMQQICKKSPFTFSINQAFKEVLAVYLKLVTGALCASAESLSDFQAIAELNGYKSGWAYHRHQHKLSHVRS